MSSSIETRNRGKVPEFGFFASDTTRIMLGELPGMPTGQFCRYATEAIIAALPLATAEQGKKMREMIMYAVERNEGKPVRPTQNPLDFPRQQAINVVSSEQVSDDLHFEEFVAPQSFFEELRETLAGGDPTKQAQAVEEWFLGMNSSKGNTLDYTVNPFEVKPTAIVMGRLYEVDFDEFAVFSTAYIMGGLFGWDARGIPDYAHESLQTLKQAVAPQE